MANDRAFSLWHKQLWSKCTYQPKENRGITLHLLNLINAFKNHVLNWFIIVAAAHTVIPSHLPLDPQYHLENDDDVCTLSKDKEETETAKGLSIGMISLAYLLSTLWWSCQVQQPNILHPLTWWSTMWIIIDLSSVYVLNMLYYVFDSLLHN